MPTPTRPKCLPSGVYKGVDKWYCEGASSDRFPTGHDLGGQGPPSWGVR